jgi:hypothetical protein
VSQAVATGISRQSMRTSPMSTEITGRPLAPRPTFCDSSSPAIVWIVASSALSSSITTEATQRVALPQACASLPSGL